MQQQHRKTKMPGGYLSDSQRKFYQENGYLLIENFLDDSTCDSLRSDCKSVVDNLDLTEHKAYFFGQNEKGTQSDGNYSSQSYFFNSWNRVGFFFEKDAFDKSGELTAPRDRCINKLGHYLHAEREPFRQVTFDARAKDIAADLGMIRPRVCQSMYIFKQPRIGGIVDSHQDATFLWTEPTCRLTGFWVALEDATLENGCLWFVPGSHRRGLVGDRRFVRCTDEDGKLRMEFRGANPNHLVPLSEYVPGEVKKGTLVLIDGFVLHMSKENKSEKSREIYTWHVIDTPDGVKWSEENWIQPGSVETGFELLYQ